MISSPTTAAGASSSVGWIRLNRAVAAALAASVVFVVLLPLAGLLWGVLDPPATSTFYGEPAGILDLVRRTRTLTLLANTFGLALSVACAACVVGITSAWAEQRCSYTGGRVFAILDLLPLAMPSYVLAATVRSSLGPGGWIGGPLDLPVFDGFGAAFVVLTAITAPYVHLLVGAALARTSAAEEEAARSLGASTFRIFRSIVLPRLRPAVAYALLIVSLYAVSDFGAVAVLDCPVLTWRLYQAVNHQQLARAGILGMAVLLATAPLIYAALRIRGRIPRLQHSANPRPVARRRPRRPALIWIYAVHFFVVGLGVVLPVVTLIDWTWNGVSRGLAFAPLTAPVVQTLTVGVASAAAILLLAIGAAWVSARRGAWVGRLLESSIWFSSALPGVLLAFGLLLSALHVSRVIGVGGRLYHALAATGVLLVMGYATRFTAEAFAAVKTSILQLDPRVEESARVLGVSRSKWFFRIALPALVPGAAAAFALLMLSLVKELPVTLLLGESMGLRTLAFRIFDRYREAFLHDAGAAGLALLAMAFAAVAVSLRWRRHV